jgi:ankyrin repeat protein
LIYLLTLSNVKLDCIDIDGNSALHYAVINENPKMVYQLLMSAAREDLVNNENYTAYQLALKTENRSLIGLFVG